MARTISVNGKIHEVEAEDDTPLLWVLRDHLDMTGTKFGCGKGLCGACTVNIDGVATRSCQIPVGSAAGRKISTIEALGERHPELVDTWSDLNVPQCGYCQAGQLMSAAALLDQNPRPSENDIDTAMAGNICRCGCYSRIKGAIQEAARRRA
ncbi:MAG: (2Fe-2S)-binding protein [Pseudomonadales bacterium]|jgi:isoquinoline 1-oxidoreductase alpha subunit|nr:(2Fe-2S)-binding protein [Pseudomonadales bacterium]HAO55997.1 isoquinoline 1-oxidoreductase [Gammaproteobacteria bacterium]|tara:strand:- start:2375 stop:2830 length:456 start_codon:yes stop_codon:yes gene_type:complete